MSTFTEQLTILYICILEYCNLYSDHITVRDTNINRNGVNTNNSNL